MGMLFFYNNIIVFWSFARIL